MSHQAPVNPFRRGNRRSAKINGQTVLEIREDYQKGTTQGELSRKHSLSIGQIGRIVRGESWQTLPMPGLTEEQKKELAIMQIKDVEMPPLTETQKQQILESQERLKRYMENTDISIEGKKEEKNFGEAYLSSGLEKLNSVLNSLPPAPISVDDFLEEAKK